MALAADLFLMLYLSGVVGMTVALTKHYPEFNGWENVSRSMGWPVTIYEILSDRI